MIPYCNLVNISMDCYNILLHIISYIEMREQWMMKRHIYKLNKPTLQWFVEQSEFTKVKIYEINLRNTTCFRPTSKTIKNTPKNAEKQFKYLKHPLRYLFHISTIFRFFTRVHVRGYEGKFFEKLRKGQNFPKSDFGHNLFFICHF